MLLKGESMNVTKILIDKAVENEGSLKAVAKKLGLNANKLSQQRNGHVSIQPDDLAAIAHVAGYNAMNVLAAATLEKTTGTQKGALLDEALGKLFADSGKPEKRANSPLIQCGFTLISDKRPPLLDAESVGRWLKTK